MKPRRGGASRGYEEMDGANVPTYGGTRNGTSSGGPPSNDPSSPINNNNNSVVGGGVPPEFELASVSVVPDDTFTVTQAVNALGFGWFQVKLSLCVGLCWMADSMEMTILSVLGPALHCDWGITRYQQALVTTVVFLGMMLSSTFWGHLSDRYGRKPVSLVMIC